MKAFIVSAAILAATATAAHADSTKVRNSMAQMPQHQRVHQTAMNTNDVIVDGHTVGRDPSAHVRSSLATEYYALQATGMEGGGIGDAGGGDAGGGASQ